VRAFTCPHCHALVFFENSVCVTCGSAIGYSRSSGEFLELGLDGGPQACANLAIASCNWVAEGGPLCPSCVLTRTLPADGDELLPEFARAETAKRRLIFQLDALGLPTTPRVEDPEGGLAFDLLSSAQGAVTTGHDSGVITLDLAEGDDPHREAMRVQLDEAYRTLLGHMRHEVGHWYWEVLVSRPGGDVLDRFRELFGDDRLDYAEALKKHYAASATGWEDSYVSVYATAHPWEDWAETFAHYLHIRDTLQTAAAFGMAVAGPDLDIRTDVSLSAEPEDEPDDFTDLVSTWLPLTFALNAVNRSMGKDDLYPFVLSPAVLRKIRFVHDLVAEAGSA
jgi:hypothetical protein